MKVSFTLTDEKTVTNTTVKIHITISGTIDGDSRENLEARCLETAKKIFPDSKWAFANFKYNPDGLTFTVSASTRIDTSQNDQLADKCAEASDGTKTRVVVGYIDPSIPAHDIRVAESDIRENVIKLAGMEAKRLGGKVISINFHPSYPDRGSGRMGLESASYAAAAPNGGSQLGHSEKLFVSSEIVVKVKDD